MCRCLSQRSDPVNEQRLHTLNLAVAACAIALGGVAVVHRGLSSRPAVAPQAPALGQGALPARADLAQGATDPDARVSQVPDGLAPLTPGSVQRLVGIPAGTAAAARSAPETTPSPVVALPVAHTPRGVAGGPLTPAPGTGPRILPAPLPAAESPPPAATTLPGATGRAARPPRPRAAAVSAPAPATRTASANTPAARTYTVAPGDTLQVIAARLYGDARHWPAIFDANRDRLTEPGRLRVGQQLTIPGG